MRYAILCYDSEAAMRSWTKAEDDALTARLAVVEQKLAAEGKLGPNVRLMPTTAATTMRKAGEPLATEADARHFGEVVELLLELRAAVGREAGLPAPRLVGEKQVAGAQLATGARLQPRQHELLWR